MSAAMIMGFAMTGASAEDKIVIGNTSPYSGPISALGEIGKNMKAYFDKVNAEGGINGRTIEFITYDDAYAPPKTVEATRRLVERDKVLFMAGSLGTAQNLAVRQYLNQKKVPQLFLGTGSSVWNDPKEFPWSMGWQPSSYVEGKVYGEFVAKYHGDKKIGILSQNDDFGRGYLKGIADGLGDAQKNIVSQITYEVSDPTIDGQIINLQSAGVEVLIDISTPKFAAQAIRKAHELSWKPLHIVPVTAASVDAVMRPAGLDASQGIVTAVYLKDPSDSRWAEDAAFNDYKAFMEKYNPKADKTSVYPVIGYSIAQTVEHVLKAAGDDLSRENILKQAASMQDVSLPMIVPGITLNTSPTDYAVMDKMQLAHFVDEAWSFYDPEKK